VTGPFELRSVLDATGIPQLEFPKSLNIAELLIDRHPAEGRGRKVAIRTFEQDVTYSDLIAEVNRFGNALKMLGLHPGDRLAMIVNDCPEFVYLFFGAIKVGVLPVPLNNLLRANDFAFIFEDSQCAAVVYSPEFAQEIEAAIAQSSWRVRHWMPLRSFSELAREALPELTALPTQAADDCFWLYSSGSTGSPKGAVHRHRDMAVCSQRYGVETLGVREADICYSEAKLFFAYGLGNNMTFPLWVGATAVLNDQRPGPASSFPLIERFKPTLYFGVPTLYAAYLQHFAQNPKPDLTSIRHCVSAGEALPAEILRRWHDETDLSILDGIGSTEALHIFISNRAGDIKPGSSGKMVPGYRARIVDEGGADVADGDSGQLFITGDSTARCYWNNAERSARTMIDGWLNTGDTYRRDADGYYYYCGRSDDMLKVGGIWCSPFEIESKLVEHPSVLEAAVVGRIDAENLIKPEAFVVLKQGVVGSERLAAELTDLCKAGLAPYKYPRWINFVTDLPKTATGKIQRFLLRN